MTIDEPFNAWLIGRQSGTDRIRMLSPPSPHDLLTQDECMLLSAYLIVVGEVDPDRLRALIDHIRAT